MKSKAIHDTKSKLRACVCAAAVPLLLVAMVPACSSSDASTSAGGCVTATATNVPADVIVVGSISRNALAAAYNTPYKEGGPATITAPAEGATISRGSPPTISWTAPAGSGWLYGLSLTKGVSIYTRETSYTLSASAWDKLKGDSALSIGLFVSRMGNDCVVEGPYLTRGGGTLVP